MQTNLLVIAINNDKVFYGLLTFTFCCEGAALICASLGGYAMCVSVWFVNCCVWGVCCVLCGSCDGRMYSIQ